MATRKQLQAQSAERYVRAMLRNIKVRGEEPILKTDSGVVVSERYGGATFQNEVDAYSHIYQILMYGSGVAEVALNNDAVMVVEGS